MLEWLKKLFGGKEKTGGETITRYLEAGEFSGSAYDFVIVLNGKFNSHHIPASASVATYSGVETVRIKYSAGAEQSVDALREESRRKLDIERTQHLHETLPSRHTIDMIVRARRPLDHEDVASIEAASPSERLDKISANMPIINPNEVMRVLQEAINKKISGNQAHPYKSLKLKLVSFDRGGEKDAVEITGRYKEMGFVEFHELRRELVDLVHAHCPGNYHNIKSGRAASVI